MAEFENIGREIAIQCQPAFDELNRVGQQIQDAIKQNPLLNNLFAGLDSPDLEQQARFRAAMDEHLAELNLVEHASVLRVLERAKKRRGRKIGSKRCMGDDDAHQKMRDLKASNPTMSKTKAAHIAAKEIPHGRAQAKSVEKRIARTYPGPWDFK